MKPFNRTFACPSCGAAVRFPTAWVLGVEVVFKCGACNRKFKTGYKTGAALFALALVLALAVANLGVWLFSSFTLPVFVLAVIPLWIGFGFRLRRWHLIRQCGKPKE